MIYNVSFVNNLVVKIFFLFVFDDFLVVFFGLVIIERLIRNNGDKS